MTARRLSALLLLAAAPALAQDAAFTIDNQSGLLLMELSVSPVGEASFGDDLLGADFVVAGESGTVTIPGGVCEVDLRFVFEDGSEVVDSVDVCATSAYTLVGG